MLGIISQRMSNQCAMPSERDFQPSSQDTSEVSIYGNDDWVAQNWSGNGTVDYPYRVENLTLTFIEIINSDAYFINFAFSSCTLWFLSVLSAIVPT